MNFPLPRDVVDSIFRQYRIDPAKAAIREMVLTVSEIEKNLGVKFLRMEFGVPGLPSSDIGREAEADAIERKKIANQYPPLAGIPALKKAGAEFLKAFLNIDIGETSVIPTVGAMQGGFLSQAIVGNLDPKRNGILTVAPCFSVNREQTKFLGLQEHLVDLYDRSGWLDRVENLCAQGKIAGILYSTPNNPSWVILTDGELKRLGAICDRYDVVAIEDAAYLGMDFRQDYSVPNRPPYPPTVARYTERSIILLSASKIFSYAGQRVGIAAISPALAARSFPNLEARFGYSNFLDAFVMNGMYGSTSGVSHSAQIALAAMFEKASRGEFNFLKPLRAYGERAKVMKEIFTSNGFSLVYAEDMGQPLADGFFFTLAYPGMTGGELVRNLLDYGISATTLAIAGSERREAIRACSSLIADGDLPLLTERVRAFHGRYR